MISNLLESRPLFKECLESLGAALLPKEEAEKMSLIFKRMFPITQWGKIDWERIDKKIDIGYEPKNIIHALAKIIPIPFDKSVYIEWSTSNLPVMKTDLDAIIRSFDDVTCVSFEKFIFNPVVGYVIEILPSYQMTAGVISHEGNQI